MRFYATLFEKLKFYSIGIEWNNEFSCNTLHEMEKRYYFFFAFFSWPLFYDVLCIHQQQLVSLFISLRSQTNLVAAKRSVFIANDL